MTDLKMSVSHFSHLEVRTAASFLLSVRHCSETVSTFSFSALDIVLMYSSVICIHIRNCRSTWHFLLSSILNSFPDLGQYTENERL